MNTTKAPGTSRLPSRLPNLAGLRVLGATLVVSVHVLAVLAFHGYHELPSFITGRGPWLFFVLSGFLLGGSVPNLRTDLGTYWRRRFIRIWPLHILVLTLVSLVSLTGIGERARLETVVSNSLLTQKWWLEASTWSHSINLPTWALSVEIFFYLLYPFIVTLTPDRTQRARAAVLGLWVVLLLLTAPFPIPTALRDLPIFFIGVQFRRLAEGGWRPRLPRTAGVFFLLVGLYALNFMYGDPYAWEIGRFGCTIGFALIILGSALARENALNSKPAQTLAGWSYAYFILNAPVLSGFGVLVLTHNLPLMVAVSLTIFIAIALWPLAGLVHRYVEEPITRALTGEKR